MVSICLVIMEAFSFLVNICSILTAEGGEQKKKRVKADSDISRMTPTSRMDSLASLKGEQVWNLCCFIYTIASQTLLVSSSIFLFLVCV